MRGNVVLLFGSQESGPKDRTRDSVPSTLLDYSLCCAPKHQAERSSTEAENLACVGGTVYCKA